MTMQWTITEPVEFSGPSHPVIEAWRVRADGTRIGRAYIFAFEVLPNPVNGHQEVMAVYANAESGRMAVEYLENFEVDVSMRPLYTTTAGPPQTTTVTPGDPREAT